MSSKYLELKSCDFRHPIQIFKYISEENEDNIPIDTQNKLTINARAKVINVSGREIILSNGDASYTTQRFYIRYRKIKFTPQDAMLKYNNNLYNILSITDVEEAHKVYEIVAELVSNGN